MEVLKGSSQIQYGPQTTGGVINYLSTQIPLERTFYSKNTYGSDHAILSHTYYGDTVQTANGDVGYLLELFYNQNDGFRNIERGTGYSGSDNTGFSVVEPMLKIFWEPDTPLQQRFEFKYGYSDFEADESYAGLSELDARRRPDRRYAGSRFDHIQTSQHRSYLKYLIEPSDSLKLETAAYYNRFERDWVKLDGLESPGGNSVREALTTAQGLDTLRGRGPGALIVRHNARVYESYGVQFSGEKLLTTGEINHTLSFGARLHADYVERDQFDDVYNQDATGAIVSQQFQLDNVRTEESDAISLWVKDELDFGRLKLTPGLRYEHIDVSVRDGNEDKTRVGSRAALAANRAVVTFTDDSGSIDELIPGVSANYELDDGLNLFGGVHRGISIPGPRSGISGTDVEKSIGYELGGRYGTETVQAELVGFFTDFSNILNTDAGLGAGGNNTTNGGESEVYGLEALVSYDPLAGSGASLPMYVSATWTSAEFKETIVAGGSDGIFDGGTDGSEIPYIPEWKLAAGIGYNSALYGVNVDMVYTSSVFGTAGNQTQTTNNAREGKINGLITVDLNSYYQLNENIRLVGGIANVFDEREIVTRIPRGPRTNQGRTAYLGFEAKF